MKNIFAMFLMLIIYNTIAKAQFSNYDIGTIRIGYDSLYASKIGKAITPACSFPGPCGSGCAVYTFKGAGNWNIEGNWESNIIPPVILSGCTQIIINPAGNNECLLNIPLQIIPAGTSLSVMPGKRFRIPGKLDIK
jgi:hypothetical protein